MEPNECGPTDVKCDPCDPTKPGQKAGGLNETLDTLRTLDLNKLIDGVEKAAADATSGNYWALLDDAGNLSKLFATIGEKDPASADFPKMTASGSADCNPCLPRLDAAAKKFESARAGCYAIAPQCPTVAGETCKPCAVFSPAMILTAMELIGKIVDAIQAWRKTLPAPTT